MKNNKVSKKILINSVLILLVATWAYFQFVQVEPYVIKSDQDKVKFDPSSCINLHKEGIYDKLTPNTICKTSIYRNDKLIKNCTENIGKNGFRKTPNKFNRSKKSIVVFGGSFAYGFGLNDNETFPWLLSEKTNRKVYNAALNSGGAQQMLLNLQSDDFLNKIKNPDTFIYVFIFDHLNRLYGPPFYKARDMYYPIYKMKNNKLELTPMPLSYKIGGIISEIATYQAYRKKVQADPMSKETLDLFTAIIKESQKIINEKYPDSRFIVLDIHSDKYVDKVLKENNIEVIPLRKFFYTPDMEAKYINLQYHPQAAFWQKITPLFIKKANI